MSRQVPTHRDEHATPTVPQPATDQSDVVAAAQSRVAPWNQRTGRDPSILTSRDVLHLQRTVGNQAVCGLLARTVSQPVSLMQRAPGNDNKRDYSSVAEGGLERPTKKQKTEKSDSSLSSDENNNDYDSNEEEEEEYDDSDEEKYEGWEEQEEQEEESGRAKLYKKTGSGEGYFFKEGDEDLSSIAVERVNFFLYQLLMGGEHIPSDIEVVEGNTTYALAKKRVEEWRNWSDAVREKRISNSEPNPKYMGAPESVSIDGIGKLAVAAWLLGDGDLHGANFGVQLVGEENKKRYYRVVIVDPGGAYNYYAENVSQEPTRDEYNMLPDQPVKFKKRDNIDGDWEILNTMEIDTAPYIENNKVEVEKYQTMQQLKDIDVEELQKKLMALETAVKSNHIATFKGILEGTSDIPDPTTETPEHIANLTTRLRAAQQMVDQLPNPEGAT